MRKTKYQKFETDKVELLKNKKDLVVIKNKETAKYYTMNEEELEHFLGERYEIKWNDRYTHFNKTVVVGFWILFVLLTMLNIVYYFKYWSLELEYSPAKESAVIIFYLIISIILHEAAHIIMLRLCGRKEGKIGIKFNYIFPAGYVNVNEVNMLTKTEKLLVHSAGLFTNLLVNNIIFQIAGNNIGNEIIRYLVYASVLMSTMILYNSLPFLNSDGYKIFLCIFDLKEYKEYCKSNAAVKVIKIINYIFSVGYLFLVIKNTLFIHWF